MGRWGGQVAALEFGEQAHGFALEPASRLVRTSLLMIWVETAELMLAIRSLSRGASVGSERKVDAALSISCCVRLVVQS
jgi:hypothetical protein